MTVEMSQPLRVTFGEVVCEVLGDPAAELQNRPKTH